MKEWVTYRHWWGIGERRGTCMALEIMFGSPPLPHSPRKLANYHVKTRKNLSQEDFFYFYWLQFILTFPSEILLIYRWYKYTGKLNFFLIHQKSSAECFRNRLSLPPLTSFGALLQVLLRPWTDIAIPFAGREYILRMIYRADSVFWTRTSTKPAQSCDHICIHIWPRSNSLYRSLYSLQLLFAWNISI